MQPQILFSSLLLSTVLSTSVLAHNIQTDGNVGVTFHIEPDHSPRAGEESQAWFALTRQGGELIALSECDCELKVYLESATGNEPILNPTLVAISPEQYRDVPGAELVFPQPGIYQLELTGKPTQEGSFTPFQVSYPVTVNPSIAPSLKEVKSEEVTTTPQEQIQANNIVTEEPEIALSPQFIPWAIGGLAVVVGIVAVVNFSKK